MLPNKLKKGDTIGVIAPSNCIKQDDLEYINASISLMEKAGLNVKFGKYVFGENEVITNSQNRAKDINEMFNDKEVKAIMCVKGGEDSNTTLDYIDYETIKQNPKILCGFSDNTSILNVINSKTGLVTYHGPTFKSLTSWDSDYAYDQLIKVFCEGVNNLDDAEYITIKEGQAQGELIGGNLFTFMKLICGKYKVDLKGKILFLEELGFESTPRIVNSCIYYLKQNGVFEDISGLWIGNYEHPTNISLEEIIKNAIGDVKIPIIKSDNFGHIDKKSIIPIGVKAEIDTKEKVKIRLLEKCVKED